MAVTRDALASYLASQFSSLALAVGQDPVALFGFEPDINNALRRLGTGEGDLMTATLAESDRAKVCALVEYYAARRFWRLLSDRVNVSIGGNSFNFAHLLANAKLLMEDAAHQCAVLGIDVTGTGWSVGYLSLDWLEPESYA